MPLQSTISFYACCNSAIFPFMAEFVAGKSWYWPMYLLMMGRFIRLVVCVGLDVERIPCHS